MSNTWENGGFMYLNESCAILSICLKFHQMAAILSAILETVSQKKSNFKRVWDINECDACIKF